MDRQLSRLVRLVDDLLDVGRISAGKPELKREPLEVGLALAGSWSPCAAVESAQQILTLHATAEPLWIMDDRDRLAPPQSEWK